MQYVVWASYSAGLFLMGGYLLKHDKNGQYFSILKYSIFLSAILYITYFVGLRSVTIFGDTSRYTWAYEGLTSLGDARHQGEIYFGNNEWLFWTFSYVLKSIGLSPQAWLASMVIIPSLLLSISYRKVIKSFEWIYVFAAIYLSYYLVFSVAIRQSMAEALVLLSFVLAVERKVVFSLLITIIAIGFHQSAIIAIAFPVLIRIKITNKIFLAAFLGALFFSTLASSYMLMAFEYLGLNSAVDKLSMYSSGDAMEFENLFLHKQFLLLLLATVTYTLLEKESQTGIYSYVVYVFFLIFFFWSMPVMSGRMMGYVTVVFPIMVYFILKRLLKDKEAFIVFISLFSILGLLVLSAESTKYVLGIS